MITGSEVKKLLGLRIKELRKLKKMTQERLAERIGIEPNNVSMIEIGKNYPSPENLAKIAEALDIEVHELFIFNHHKNIQEVKNYIISEIEQNDDFARMVCKFCKAAKMP